MVTKSDSKSEQHFSKEAQTAIFHHRNTAKVSPFLYLQEAELLMPADTRRLHYCNASLKCDFRTPKVFGVVLIKISSTTSHVRLRLHKKYVHNRYLYLL